MINMINEVEDKDIFKRVQEKWDAKYSGLVLIVLWDEKEKRYAFTWEVETGQLRREK